MQSEARGPLFSIPFARGCAEKGHVTSSAPRVGRWFRFNLWVHRWASLVATLPFLVLCVTGIVLIFHEEIDAALGVVPTNAAPTESRLADCMANVARDFPDQRVLSVGLEPEEHPGVFLVVVGPPTDTGFDHVHLAFYELGTGKLLGDSDPSKTFTGVILKLHAEWFLGPAGRLLGALLGLLVMASLLSGLVIYAPYMRKVAFGVIRRGRGARLTQLDLHNVIGAVVLGWAFVVAATGFLLGFSQVAFGVWQYTDLATLRAEYAHEEPVDVRAPPAPVARVIGEMEAKAPPGWGVRSVIFPGTEFTTPRHYGVVMGGSEGLDARLLDVTLVDAATGDVVRKVEMPGYLQAIFLSEPLHFGNYGGLALKVFWTMCSLMTLFITANGAWLFFDRRRARKLVAKEVAA